MTTEKIKAVVGIATLVLMYHGIAQSTELQDVADELLDKAIENLVALTGLKESVIVQLMDNQCNAIQKAIYNVEQGALKENDND